MQPIDVTMVAVRRPVLVQQVLASYRDNVFANIPIRRFFLNIDPLWGTEDDDRAVERLARDAVPAEVEVFRPSTPSLTAALKRLWAKPQTDWFLHMEDDWTVSAAVSSNRLARHTRDSAVGQIRFAYWYQTKRFTRPVEFGTAPAFNRTAFARRVADLWDVSMHPERQMYAGNASLAAWVRQWRPRYYGSMFTAAAIVDIGKAWQAERGIAKSMHAVR